jgi:hypothetical protein
MSAHGKGSGNRRSPEYTYARARLRSSNVILKNMENK